MSDDNAMSGHFSDRELLASIQSDATIKSSRRDRSDQKWDSLKDEIYSIYMINDFTLRKTMRAIVEKHGFKASERKWKEKLKEWNFDKNISAADMRILVATADKRAREEGKETVFFRGQSEVTKERIEQFKRRKMSKEMVVSPEAEMPKNIIYHTPPHDDFSGPLEKRPEEGSKRSWKPAKAVPRTTPHPSDKTFSGYQIIEEGTKLPIALGSFSENELRESAFLISRAIQNYNSVKSEDSISITCSGAVNANVRQLRPEVSSKLDLNPSEAFEELRLGSNDPGLLFPDIRDPYRRLDYLSHDLSRNLTLEVSRTGSKDEIIQETAPSEVTVVEIPQPCVREGFEHKITTNEIEHVNKLTYSNQTELSTLNVDSSSVSESNFRTSTTSSTVILATEDEVKKAFELHATGWRMESIFQNLGCDDFETRRNFCDKLWKMYVRHGCHGTKDLLEDALIALNVVHEGYSLLFGPSSKETMECLAQEATLQRRKREYKLSELASRKAIEGFRVLGRKNRRLKCQGFLGDLLRILGRISESWYLLIETLIEHFTLVIVPLEIYKVIGSMEKLQSRVEIDGDMLSAKSSISRLKEILDSQQPLPHRLELLDYMGVWTEFIQLGKSYSEVGIFDLADYCFAFPEPKWTDEPAYTDQPLRFHNSLFLHYTRQRKVAESLAILESAIHQLSLLSTEVPSFDQLVYEVEQLLKKIESGSTLRFIQY